MNLQYFCKFFELQTILKKKKKKKADKKKKKKKKTKKNIQNCFMFGCVLSLFSLFLNLNISNFNILSVCLKAFLRILCVENSTLIIEQTVKSYILP